MKIFVIHTKANLCANNSDNKMWIVADNAETAKIIAVSAYSTTYHGY